MCIKCVIKGLLGDELANEVIEKLVKHTGEMKRAFNHGHNIGRAYDDQAPEVAKVTDQYREDIEALVVVMAQVAQEGINNPFNGLSQEAFFIYKGRDSACYC